MLSGAHLPYGYKLYDITLLYNREQFHQNGLIKTA